MTTAVTIAPAPILQFFNNLGAPNVGGSILTQVGGLNYATYQDSAGTVPLPNPIPLNSRGEISNAAGLSTQLFLASNIAYVFTMFDVNGNQLNQATYVANTDVSGIAGAGMVGFSYGLGYAIGTVGRWLQDLALAAGSTFIGWIQSGTGAVTRTVSSKIKETISVKDYGADPTNTSDSTAAFNLASAYLKTIGGGTLFIPAGTYRLDGQFLIDFSNIRIIGSGIGSTILRCNAWVDGIRVASGYPVSTAVLTDVIIENLSINGDRLNHVNGANDTAGNGINLTACDRVIVRNVEVYDMEQQGIADTYWQVAGRQADSTVIDSCIVRNTQSNRIAIGIEGRGRAARITNNSVINGGSLYVGHQTGSGIDNGETLVHGNRVDGTGNTTGVGIIITDNMYNVTVSNNFVTGYSIGIRMSSNGQSLGDAVIALNTVISWNDYGILAYPMNGTDSARVLVTGNKLKATGGTVAIYVAKNSTVTSNRIEGTAGTGISAPGGACQIFGNTINSTSYGVDLGASVGNQVLCNYMPSDINSAAAAYTNNYMLNYGGATNRGSDYYLGTNRNVSANAAPASGTWAVGDKAWNTAPGNSAGQAIGFVCTVAGAPGTWRSFGVTL